MAKLLLTVNQDYLLKICQLHGVYEGKIGYLPLLKNFNDHNNIVKLNSVWSSQPAYMPVDRTLSTKLPFQQCVPRVWQVPQTKRTLSEAMAQRAMSLAAQGQTVNILWSGGIDSTAVLTAFLQNVNHQQLRVIYSPWSTYEHPELFEFLKSFESLSMVDISGTRYMNWDFDGIFVSGDGGDEMTASLDSSFIDSHGIDILHSPWQDFVFRQTQDHGLIEFCQQHFSRAGRDIRTVLEARWWFYACFKVRSILNQKLELLFDSDPVDWTRLVGFYDCEEFESYIYWNIEHCITGNSYSGWKQVFKDYANDFQNFDKWYQTAVKNHSTQVSVYAAKKRALKQQHWLALFENGTRISTPSLPVLTHKEYFATADLGWTFNHEHI